MKIITYIASALIMVLSLIMLAYGLFKVLNPTEHIISTLVGAVMGKTFLFLIVMCPLWWIMSYKISFFKSLNKTLNFSIMFLTFTVQQLVSMNKFINHKNNFETAMVEITPTNLQYLPKEYSEKDYGNGAFILNFTKQNVEFYFQEFNSYNHLMAETDLELGSIESENLSDYEYIELFLKKLDVIIKNIQESENRRMQHFNKIESELMQKAKEKSIHQTHLDKFITDNQRCSMIFHRFYDIQKQMMCETRNLFTFLSENPESYVIDTENQTVIFKNKEDQKIYNSTKKHLDNLERKEKKFYEDLEELARKLNLNPSTT